MDANFIAVYRVEFPHDTNLVKNAREHELGCPLKATMEVGDLFNSSPKATAHSLVQPPASGTSAFCTD